MLFAIVAAICVLLLFAIAYIVVSGAGKLFDVSFLLASPRQFKEGGGIGPEAVQLVLLLVLTLLIFGALSRLAARFTLLSTLEEPLDAFPCENGH